VRLAGWLLAVVIVLSVMEVVLFAVLALKLPEPARPPPSPTQVRGAYHVHSRLSDGRWSPDEIASAAVRAGLQFVVLTDHNLIEIPPPRYVQGVLLVFATELSTPWGHVVALGLRRGLGPTERNGNVMAQIHQQNGLALLAHPVQKKNPWRNWRLAEEADGLELYSGDSLYRDALRHPFQVLLPVVGTYIVRPSWGLWMLARANPEVREQLLTLSLHRRFEAFCALDAHGWPSYEAPFQALALYLDEIGQPLSPEAGEAGEQVLSALRNGAFHCGFSDWAFADGFRMRGELDKQRRAPSGAALELVLPPLPASQLRVEVFGGGHWEEARQRLVLDRPGPLWVEIWVRPEEGLPTRSWRPWIVSSPIQVVAPGS
jgi:hypothetical protein